MDDVVSLIAHNGIWIMIIAVVAIGGWFKYRERELQIHQQMRTREMEHLQKMKELEVELERTKAKQTVEKP